MMKRWFKIDSSVEKRIDEEALDWILGKDTGLSSEEEKTFELWLKKDPRHAKQYRERLETWQKFDTMELWQPQFSDDSNPDLFAAPATRLRKLVAPSAFTGLAAAFVVGLFFWMPRSSEVEPQRFFPAENALANDYQQHRLHDGTIVELNKGAQIRIDYDQSQRYVKLLSGEVFFFVEKDNSRPFIVEAGGATVRAIGTAFNVKLENDVVAVLVTEGRVEMNTPETVGQSIVSLDQESQADEASLLEAGQSIVLSLSSTVDNYANAIEEVTQAQLSSELAWKHRMIDFQEESLEVVVNAFNRQNITQVIINDHELRDLKVTATFHSDNVDGFVRLLELSLPVRAHATHDGAYALYNVK